MPNEPTVSATSSVENRPDVLISPRAFCGHIMLGCGRRARGRRVSEPRNCATTPRRVTWILLLVGLLPFAQPPDASHPGEYAPADIAYGARVYDAQCTTCHGAGGDGVGGVNLRSGRFRNATTDQDLTRVITTGIQGTAMPAFKLDAAEVAGVIAYLRNMNNVDRGSMVPGDAARGRAIYASHDCARCHRIGAAGSHVAPDLTDI